MLHILTKYITITNNAWHYYNTWVGVKSLWNAILHMVNNACGKDLFYIGILNIVANKYLIATVYLLVLTYAEK